MKARRPFQIGKLPWYAAALPLLCVALGAVADDTNAPAAAPPPLTPQQFFEGGTNTYNNWVTLSAGGFFTSGNEAQFQQLHHTGTAFGGIEDLHYQADLNTNQTTHLTLDGHGLFDNHDYSLRLNVANDNLGYVRFSYSEFRTWYNGDGGFYPPTGEYFSYPSDDALTLDRSELTFEAGLRMQNKPKITFRYTHKTREGDKGSTSWGDAHVGYLGSVVAGLSPTTESIDEHSDTFQLDATHHIKKTDLGLGVEYETGRLDDALKIVQSPGEPAQEKITNQQGTSYDMFNVHAFTETWFKDNLMLSSGYSYSDLDNDFTGSRIYGSDFDVGYVPMLASGFGYLDLNGGSRLHDYVMNLNLLTVPVQHLTITPSIRVEKEDMDADANGVETLNDFSSVPFNGASDRDVIDVRERLDLRYNAITNWVFWGRGEWTEGQGNLSELGGLTPVEGFGVPPVDFKTDDSRFFQKYSAGARWYPARSVTLNAGGYYKLNRYDYNNMESVSLGDYPGFLVMQDFETYDGNVGLTLRPLNNVSLISRYEYQSSNIHTRPNSLSGLSEVESSDMTSHILAQDITWVPWSRLYLQAGFNYVLSETKTPASDYTAAILNAQNNYWTLNFNSTFVVDDLTDFNLGYFYYRADDYQNIPVGVPFGAGAEQHGLTAGIVRRISKNMRLTLRYAFSHYTDELYGGHRDFDAHLVYSSLQYRF